MTAAMPDLEALLTQAIDLHQDGKLDEACCLYQQILNRNPRHAQAHYLLGIAAMQRGQDMQAVESFRRSLASQNRDANTHFHLGLAMVNLEQIPSALQAFEATVQIDPNHARAYGLIGNCQTKLGRNAEGAEAYEKSLQLESNNLEAANNLGNIRKLQGRLDEAAQLYQHALQLSPNNPDILFNLSQTFQDALRFDLAIPILRQAIAMNPHNAGWYLQLAFALQGAGDQLGAEQNFHQAIAIDPNHAQAHYELGNVFVTQRQLADAIREYETVVQIQPSHVQATSNLGAANQMLGRMDEAYRCYQRVLQLDPRSSNALYNIGHLLYLNGKFDTAVSYLQRAHEAAPTHIDTLAHYSLALSQLHQYDLAARALERLVELQPDHADAHFNLGTVYRHQQHHDLALKCYQRSYELQPKAPNLIVGLINQKQSVCDWEGLDDLSVKFLEYVDSDIPNPTDSSVAPFMVISLSKPSTAEQQFRAARKYIIGREQFFAKPAHHSTPAKARQRHRKKIRIGYFSGDFQQHPVGYLVAELFESHNRDAFEVYGYSFGPGDSSQLRKRLVASFDRFRDIHHTSYAESAERIAMDEIDILIDLHGYTTHCRTEIVLARPAPIQVNYLGYPGTLGTKAIDYILVDEVIVPMDQQPHFAEKLVHLPGCFLVSDSKREIDPKLALRQHLGLPEEAFVFCAFNSNPKMNRRMFEVWLRLLKAVPKSVLWLRDSNKFAVANLKIEANRYGIASERLVMAPGLPMPKHLSRHRAADLFLDSFPYNQHSTAADALRMGLPLVTLMGETFVSRVAGSLLSHLGLSELIAHTFDEYETLCLRLAESPDELKNIRRKLNQSLSTTDLFDGRAFARKLETAFKKMWADYLVSDSDE